MRRRAWLIREQPSAPARVAGTVATVSDQPADAVAFPELDDDQLAIVLDLGERRRVREGEILFSPADDHYDWIVILSGSVEMLGLER